MMRLVGCCRQGLVSVGQEVVEEGAQVGEGRGVLLNYQQQQYQTQQQYQILPGAWRDCWQLPAGGACPEVLALLVAVALEVEGG
jgi:hypothetical protein